MLVYTLRLHNGTHFLNTDRRENLKALLGCTSIGRIGLVYYVSSLVIRFPVYCPYCLSLAEILRGFMKEATDYNVIL